MEDFEIFDDEPEYVEKGNKRAIRRHHRNRLLKRWKRRIDNWGDHLFFKSEEEYKIWRGTMAHKRVDTATPCSCHMCCSPRHAGGSKESRLTMQELRFLESLAENNDQQAA
jgi:hypothetical protein